MISLEEAQKLSNDVSYADFKTKLEKEIDECIRSTARNGLYYITRRSSGGQDCSALQAEYTLLKKYRKKGFEIEIDGTLDAPFRYTIIWK